MTPEKAPRRRLERGQRSVRPVLLRKVPDFGLLFGICEDPEKENCLFLSGNGARNFVSSGQRRVQLRLPAQKTPADGGKGPRSPLTIDAADDEQD